MFIQDYLPFRDSHLWNWGIVLSLIGYLLTVGDPPTVWTYRQWLEFAFAVAAALAGKGSWSFAAKRPDGRTYEK